ncbi:uncharacterized protein LOC108881912 [Lates calcarifer]|uniref:Uncharacterized protein LOC108881912 n=1 Tax=Lates calcarifer TaxID=8187 RepID=A0A4W6F5E8_LATCA|nr:uncharacterized protein LOC108881912 [Lates calcarifer]XP_018529636.1 uncharacterized protein LOC108881912 [Lates calcarifer]XP_018529637.1 uncharacterized protein LOC108881912 [Lates calcarifer]
MKVISVAVLSALFCTVVSASSKVKEEHRTAFFGEDIHIDVPPGNAGEVVFKPRTNRSAEVVLMRAGKVNNTRCHVNSLGHLVVEDVQEEDEGVYIIKNSNNPNAVKRLILIVRDCAVEQVVKYGETYYIHLNHVEGPITLEFRPSLIQANQSEIQQTTEPPPVVVYNQTAVSAEEYVGRLSVSEKRVTLHSVRMTDEGSFTVLDREGKVRRRNCLNVREHQTFMHLPYGGNLKMKLYLHYSHLNIVYRPKSDNQDRVIVDQGVLVTPLDPLLEGRLTVEGSELNMKKVHVADIGVFKVTDLAGYPVAHVYIEVEAYKLPPLTVAILSLLSLIAFMLLVCLLSCLYKVHKRNEKNKKLMLIAQQAGKRDGEAFRQVVHEAYTRFTEESLMQSVCDKPSESTEVTIKGLEVSKPGRYQALTSDNFMEMSDSGVEFTTSGIPLDSDTDGAITYASHKPLLNAVSPTAVTGRIHSDSLEATVVPDGDLSASRTPDSAMSASPASNPRSFAAATPDGSLRGAASPGTASRGTAGSDSAKTEGGAESGEAGQKEESAQST